HGGQCCTAGSRLFVEKSIQKDFVDRLAAQAEKRALGDPLDPATEQGPQVSQEQLDKILHYIDLGRKQGATLRTGGPPPGPPAGPGCPAMATDAPPSPPPSSITSRTPGRSPATRSSVPSSAPSPPSRSTPWSPAPTTRPMAWPPPSGPRTSTRPTSSPAASR